jgi:tetratricopeptide (TPR) repeat protein
VKGRIVVACWLIALACSQTGTWTLQANAADSEGSSSLQQAVELLQSAAIHAARGQNGAAERCCRELLDSPELLQHVDPHRIRTLLGISIGRQNRRAEAFELLTNVLTEQQAMLGEDHPHVESTRSYMGWLSIDMTWDTSLQVGRPAREYEPLIAVAEEAIRLRLGNGYWQLALLRLRQGDGPASLEAMRQSFQEDGGWLGQLPILAMAFLVDGQEELARDAYAVARDRAAKTRTVWDPIQKLLDQAAEQLKMTGADPATSLSREDFVAAYSRLIEAYPDVASLHAWRANHLACLGQLERAVEDLAKAAELEPVDWRFGEGLAAMRLVLADPSDQTKICRELWDDCLERGRFGPRAGDMDLVVMCSLAAHADLDRQALLERADQILAITPTRPFLELGRGMALYRCGKFEEAFQTLPSDIAGLGDAKNQGIVLVFRAMTHHRLGEKFTATRLLQSAQELYEKTFASPDVVRMPYQDAGVVDCMLRLALQEAQALIASEGD